MRFKDCGLGFSFLDLSRKEKVGLRGLPLGGVSCKADSNTGEDGGVMVLDASSVCDSPENTVEFLREGDDDIAATLVSRMARSRLSSTSTMFSWLAAGSDDSAS